MRNTENILILSLPTDTAKRKLRQSSASPRDLAARFVFGSTTGKKEKSSGGKKFLTVFGLCWADLFVGIFFICLIAFEIVIAASILAFLLAAIGLIAGIEPVTEMPIVPSILFAGTLVSLAVVFCRTFSLLHRIYVSGVPFIFAFSPQYSCFGERTAGTAELADKSADHTELQSPCSQYDIGCFDRVHHFAYYDGCCVRNYGRFDSVLARMGLVRL